MSEEYYFMTKKPVTEYVQVHLYHVSPSEPPTPDVKRLTCLLPNRPGLVKGNEVTLADYKDPNLRWRIETVSQPIPVHSVNREWNNNI